MSKDEPQTRTRALVDREERTYMRLIPYVFLVELFLAAPSLASASGQILDNALRRYEQLQKLKAMDEARPREQEAHEAEMAELAARVEAIRANTDYLKARTSAANAALEKVTEKTAEVETPDQIDLQRRAEQGDAAAQVSLGMRYAFGFSVQEDDAKAVTWYRQAAEQGNAAAQHFLGLMAGVDAGHVYHDCASGVRDDRPGLDSCLTEPSR